MMLIRPVQHSDLSHLVTLAHQAGTGLTTLTSDPNQLTKKIEGSISALSTEIESPGPEGYLFVLEDTDNGRIVGTSGLIAAVGLEQAFYSYKVGVTVHSSPELKVINPIDTLYLGNDYTGCTEICTLFLSSEYRKNDNGKLLSKCRFLFMADHRKRFSDTIIAEMRGYSDGNGHSPFWEALGQHFFSMDFSTADKLSGLGSNQFIAELMPRHPIYVKLLSAEAQAVIGQVHNETRPALKMLQAEGFHYRHYVDIFDAGPTIEADIENLNTIARSEVLVLDKLDNVNEHPKALVANGQLEFRATMTQVKKSGDGRCTLDPMVAEKLLLQPGDKIRVYFFQ